MNDPIQSQPIQMLIDTFPLVGTLLGLLSEAKNQVSGPQQKPNAAIATERVNHSLVRRIIT
jgi:hypothetical protein